MTNGHKATIVMQTERTEIGMQLTRMGRFNFNPQKLVVYHQKDEHDMISLDGS